MEDMAETKLINYNVKKSSLMVMGKKKDRKSLEKELEENPVLLYESPMQVKQQDKYLGEQICPTIGESVVVTIKKRKGVTYMAINDLVSVVNDARLDVIGGIGAALTIWEQAILPFLLGSSETWLGIPKEAIGALEEIHNYFLRRILKVGKSCQVALMYFDLGQILMAQRIIKSKLLFLKHIADLDNKSLAKELYNKQKENPAIPSIISELEGNLIEMDMTLYEMEQMSKVSWKKQVAEYIKWKNEEELRKILKKSHKIDSHVVSEKCEVKKYMRNMTYDNALVRFRLRAKLFPTIKSHYKNNPTFSKDNYSCPEGCIAVDNCCHIKICIHYADLREYLSLNKEEDLVTYFISVLKRRLKNEEEKSDKDEENDD